MDLEAANSQNVQTLLKGMIFGLSLSKKSTRAGRGKM